MCPNARESFVAAAKRWRCAYSEAQEISPNIYAHFHKITFMKKHLMSYEQVLYLDADMLIRADAPSPFELFAGNNVYTVRDAQEGWEPARLQAFRAEITDPWLTDASRLLGLSCDLTGCEDWFFNSGMFLLRPMALKDQIDQFIAAMPVPYPRPKWEQGKLEQAMWNCVLKAANRIELINREWNSVEPDTSGVMQTYIYHFTGTNWEWLRQRLPGYDWKSIPGARS